MAAARHTPGPWTVDGDDAFMGLLHIAVGADGRGICDVSSTPRDDDALALTAEDRANAALIAAAPDLLCALRGMVAEWEKLARYGSPIAKAANERVNAARAIIARVERR